MKKAELVREKFPNFCEKTKLPIQLAKRNLVLRYKFAFRLSSFLESGSREEGVIFHGIGVGFFMTHFPEYSNAFLWLVKADKNATP